MREFQKKCSDFVKTLDNKYGIERDPQLSFTQLMEEIGELARDINYPRLRNKEIDRKNLEGEFGDVFLQLCVLAELHNVDLEKAVSEKIEILTERNRLPENY